LLTSTSTPPDFSVESRLLRRGLNPIAGVDEVGCGPLAGPVCAAAVILDPKNIPQGLNDSKAMTAKARELAFGLICESAVAVSFSFVTAVEIDEINIRKAALLAMSRAIGGLSIKPSYALIDGRLLPSLPCPGQAIIKGDGSSLSIAAASIVAKFMRDSLMRRVSEEYPDYGFAAHVGYGVPRHLAAIKSLGPTPHHRMSFAPLRDLEFKPQCGTYRRRVP
jgi:ribonuclease HII